MKNYLVIFTENNGARVEKRPDFIELHRNDSNVLLNPELPKGVSPTHWIKVGDKIGVCENTVNSPRPASKYIDERIVRLKKQVKIYKIATILLSSTVVIGLICLL
jgi:hypothetical protein